MNEENYDLFLSFLVIIIAAFLICCFWECMTIISINWLHLGGVQWWSVQIVGTLLLLKIFDYTYTLTE